MATIRSSIFYTARRSLALGHLAEAAYVIDLDMADATFSIDDVKDVERSQGGATETLFHRQDILWRLVFAPVRGLDLLFLREFLDSTESGQGFQVTLYGDEPTPISLKRIEDSHAENVFQRVGAAEADYFQATINALQTAGPVPGSMFSSGDGGGVSGDDSNTIDIYSPDVGGPTGGLDPPVLLTEDGDRLTTEGADELALE